MSVSVPEGDMRVLQRTYVSGYPSVFWVIRLGTSGWGVPRGYFEGRYSTGTRRGRAAHPEWVLSNIDLQQMPPPLTTHYNIRSNAKQRSRKERDTHTP
jgi:hypothetical protein